MLTDLSKRVRASGPSDAWGSFAARSTHLVVCGARSQQALEALALEQRGEAVACLIDVLQDVLGLVGDVATAGYDIDAALEARIAEREQAKLGRISR